MELLRCFFTNFFQIDLLYKEMDCIEILLSTNVKSACCPICGKETNKKHSLYNRTILDLPFVNFKLILTITAKRFFCVNESCFRKIFCERLIKFAKVYARRTERLELILEKLSISMSAISASKISNYLNVKVSNSTLLRITRKIDLEVFENFKIIAIDDWAIKKRNTYGTIVCDHKTNKVIDIFQGRETVDLENWLEKSNTIEIITRDGALTYKSAIDNFDSEIIQIGDRFHILSNLLKYLIEFVKNNFSKRIKIIESVKTTEILAGRSTNEDKELNEKKTAKLELIMEVRNLYHKEKYSMRKISKILKLAKGTVSRYIKEDENIIINYNMTKPRPSIVEEYSDTIKEMLNKGHNFLKIYNEIKTLGYTGKYGAVKHYINNNLMKDEKSTTTKNLNNDFYVITQNEIIFNIWRNETFKDEIEEKLYSNTEKYSQIKSLIYNFRKIVKNKEYKKLDDWIKNAIDSNIKELKSFSNGLLNDIEAVKNAIKYSYNNGLAEGHINRLKVIKRIMYGRANIDLLRIKCVSIL